MEKVSATLVPQLQNSASRFYPIKKDNINYLSISIEELNLTPPINEGEVIAHINIFEKNNLIYSTNICSSTYISKKQPAEYLFTFLMQYKNYFKIY